MRLLPVGALRLLLLLLFCFGRPRFVSSEITPALVCATLKRSFCAMSEAITPELPEVAVSPFEILFGTGLIGSEPRETEPSA